MSKQVFITGAKGFLGRHCARAFALEGWRVIGFGHGSWTEKEYTQWGINAWTETAISLEAVRGVADQYGLPKAIIHCAGSGTVSYSYEHPREDFCNTVGTTVDILEFARNYSPDIAVLYPSSAAVYGLGPHANLTEESALIPVSPYGKHKLMAEQACHMYARQWNVPVTVIRFFSLFGAGLQKQLLWDACRKAVLRQFHFFGDGQEARDLLHVEDAARLIGIALTRASAECPTVNGGAGTAVTVRELLEYIGKNLPCPQSPSFSGQAKQGDPPRLVADTRKAQSWGFTPSTSWQQGVRFYLDWFFKEHGQ